MWFHTIGSVGILLAFSVEQNQALAVAVIVALLAMVPLLTTLALALVGMYAKVREAWIIANENRDTLHQTVIPKLNAISDEGESGHASIITAINNGRNGDTADTTTQ